MHTGVLMVPCSRCTRSIANDVAIPVFNIQYCAISLDILEHKTYTPTPATRKPASTAKFLSRSVRVYSPTTAVGGPLYQRTDLALGGDCDWGIIKPQGKDEGMATHDNPLAVEWVVTLDWLTVP